MTGLRTEYKPRCLSFGAERLKLIDETGMNLAVTRLYGRAASGVWVGDRMPHHYGENISLLAALGVAGVSTPMTVEGAVDNAVLHTDVERVLGLTLKPGNIVVWNNLAVHKVAGIAESIESREARLESLPPYSPELNPIGQCWAKLKTILRQACVRTRRRLDAALKRDYRRSLPPMRRPGSFIVAILYVNR